jgi:hypothetical protein
LAQPLWSCTATKAVSSPRPSRPHRGGPGSRLSFTERLMGWTQRRPRPGGLLTGRGLDRFDQSGGWWEAIHLPSCSERAAKVWVWQRKGKGLSDCTAPVCRGGADARQRWAKGGRTDDAGGSDRAHPRDTGEHGNAPGPWGRQGALRAQPYTEPVRRSLVTLVTPGLGLRPSSEGPHRCVRARPAH